MSNSTITYLLHLALASKELVSLVFQIHTLDRPLASELLLLAWARGRQYFHALIWAQTQTLGQYSSTQPIS